MNAASLLCEGLSVRVGGVSIVDDISFTVGAGELVGLVGESGSGKTVTGKAIAGLLSRSFTVTAERLSLGGTSLLPPVQKRPKSGEHVAMVFQNPFTALDPNFTVGSFLIEILRRNRDMRGPAARDEAAALLELVQLRDPLARLRSYPHELSGGQQQRVMIALALAMEADFIVADEPTTALDVTVQAEVVGVLDDVRRTRNIGVIFISHDLALVNDLSDRFYVMRAGHIVEEGNRENGFSALRDPYSRLLANSVPAVDRVNIGFRG